MKSKTYIYFLPDDYELEGETRRKLDEFVDHVGMNNTQAQQMVDLHVELVEEYADKAKDTMIGYAVTSGAISALVTALIVLFITTVL